MNGIVLQTNAVKVVNREGGYPTKTFREEIKTTVPMPKPITIKKRMISTVKAKGTDYVIFVCPAPSCGKRNKRSVYEAKAQTQDGRLSFKCNGCYREIEVQRPMQDIHIPEPMIHDRGIRPGTLFGPNGKPIGV
jgi:hypothetical protein